MYSALLDPAVCDNSCAPPYSWFPVIVYLVFVFTISIIFSSIVVAQFTTSFSECSAQAKVNVILSKNEIMRKMDDTINCCGCCVSVISLSYVKHAL